MDTAIVSNSTWFNQNATDVCEKYIAIASRNFIHIYKNIQGNHPEYHLTLQGHLGKVNSCKFNPNKSEDGSTLLASCSEDCRVYTWDIEQGKKIKENFAHGSSKVYAIDWSQVDPMLVVSGDEKGSLVAQGSSPKAVKFYPDSTNTITSLACSPFNADHVCVGYKNGNVVIASVADKQRGILKKFQDHKQDIQSVIWPALKLSNEELHKMIDGKFPPNDNYQNASRRRNDPTTYPQQNNFRKPIDFEQIKENLKKELSSENLSEVVMTCCKDKFIRLWVVNKAKFVRKLRIPSKLHKGRRGNDEYGKLYLNALWDPQHKFKIVSTGFNGELLLWDLTNPNRNEAVKLLGSIDPDTNHKRQVFTISMHKSTGNIITTGMDRVYKCWANVFDSPEKKPLWNLPSLGGFCYAIKESPIDNSLIALSCGDGTIKIWRPNNQNDCFDIQQHNFNQKDKITSISWHPTLPGVIAFGTENGEVGVFNDERMSGAIVSSKKHTRAVYSLAWGPKCFKRDGSTAKDVEVEEDTEDTSESIADKDQFYLYSLGSTDGMKRKILIHSYKMACRLEKVRGKTFSSSVEAEDLGTLTKAEGFELDKVTDMRWSLDMKYLAVGVSKGSVHIFAVPHMNLLFTLQAAADTINTLAWSPTIDNSPYFWLAIGGNVSFIPVFDLKDYLTAEKLSPEPLVVNEATRTLTGHTNRITGLSWSKSKAGILASSSYDGSVQIWDVLNSAPLKNYQGHISRVLSVCWSSCPIKGREEEQVYSGGEDYSIHSWRPSNVVNVSPPTTKPFWEKSIAKIIRNKKNAKRYERSDLYDPVVEKAVEEVANEILSQNNENNDEESFQTLKSKIYKCYMFNSVNKEKNEKKTESQSMPSCNIHKQKETKNMKTIFRKTVKESNKIKSRRCNLIEDVLFRIDQKEGKSSNSFEQPSDDAANNEVFTTLYGSRGQMNKTMLREMNNLIDTELEGGVYSKSMVMLGFSTMKCMTGDISGLVEESAAAGALNDHIVAMSAGVSSKLWMKTCKMFADQSFKNKNYLKAFTYYNACSEVELAMKSLIEGNFQREAFVFARYAYGDDCDKAQYHFQMLYDWLEKTGVIFVELRSLVNLLMGNVLKAADNCSEKFHRETVNDDSKTKSAKFYYGMMSSIICKLKEDSSKEELKHMKNLLKGISEHYNPNFVDAKEASSYIGKHALFYKMTISVFELLIHNLKVSNKKKHFGSDFNLYPSMDIKTIYNSDLTFLEQCKKMVTEMATDYLTDNLLPNSVCEDFKLFLLHVLEGQNNLTTSNCAMHMSACIAAMQLRKHLNLEDDIINKVEKASKDLLANQTSLSVNLKENFLDILDGKEKSEHGAKHYPDPDDKSLGADVELSNVNKLTNMEDKIITENISGSNHGEADIETDLDLNETSVEQKVASIKLVDYKIKDVSNIENEINSGDKINAPLKNGVSGGLIKHANGDNLNGTINSSQTLKSEVSSS